MRVLQSLSRFALFSTILLIGIGCKRGKLPVEGGGSPARTDESKTTPQFVQNISPRSNAVVTPKGNPDVGRKKQPEISPKPKANPGPAPEWDNVKKQEWVPGEKLILSAEDAKNYIPGTLRVSPDGGHFAYGRKFTGSEAMLLDGKDLARLQQLDPKQIYFSADSKHMVYAGQKSDTDGQAIVRDDKVKLIKDTDAAGYMAVTALVLTGDAAEIGAILNQSIYSAVIVNDKKIHDYSNVAFNSAGKLRYAILAQTFINVDGTEQKKFENCSAFQFSDNGMNFAYIVAQSGEQFVVFGQSEERAYQKIDSLVLSPDGKRYAHRADHEGKQYLIVDGKPKAYTGSFKRSALFSPDSTRWATVLDNKVIVDHVADRELASIDANTLGFSPDSRRYAYVATNGNNDRPKGDESAGQQSVVVDGKELGHYDAVAKTPIFSADGQSIAYLAQRFGKWAIYINGKKHADVPFDPQGRSVLEFSPDSRSIGYAASVDLVWHILLDGKLIEKNEEIGPEGTRIGFGPDGSFTYFIKRKGAYYWVMEKRKG